MSKKKNNFFIKSQKKIKNLKQTLQKMYQKEHKVDEEIKIIPKNTKEPIQEVRVVLSIDSVFKSAFAILLVIAMVYLLIFVKDIIIIFLVSLFLAAAFNPAVDRMQRYKIPRTIGIFIMYTLVIGLFVVLFTSLVPIIAEQITLIAVSLRDMIQGLIIRPKETSFFVKKFAPFLNQFWQNVDQNQLIITSSNALKQLGAQLTNIAGNAVGAVFAIFSGLMNTILVLIITFFMILNKANTSNFFHSLFASKYSAYISLKTGQISVKIGEWIRGQILLAFAMGILAFTVFSIIRIDFSLTLAMVASIGEFIPYLGPLITFIAAALIAFNQDPVLVLWLIPAYAIIQFIESNIMVPFIIGKSVGLNPIVVLFALFSGASIGAQIGGNAAMGLLGMILAVPVANIISIFVEDYTEKVKR